MSEKKVGILGSGTVAQTLGSGFLKHGYEVKLGTRSPAKLTDWQKSAGDKAQVGSFAEAAAFGDIVVLAAKGSVAKSVLALAEAKNLEGKVVLDATNPIADAPPQNGVLGFFTALDRSLMEDLQSAFPQARFVKAFSCIGAPFMVNPKFGDQRPTMFICGNDEEAKQKAGNILEQFGFETADMGKVEAARAIEPLCILWCIPGLLRNQWGHAFKLLKAG
jgi:predicted dinucleotide-binding enzyme